MRRTGVKRVKDIFWYSDSEPNEILIAMCHLFVLPLAIYTDFEVRNYFLAILGIVSGGYQLYAALWCGCLNKRLIAVQVAVLVGIGTCVNLYKQDILSGSRLGWIIICLFALWNMIRVFNEKVTR